MAALSFLSGIIKSIDNERREEKSRLVARNAVLQGPVDFSWVIESTRKAESRRKYLASFKASIESGLQARTPDSKGLTPAGPPLGQYLSYNRYNQEFFSCHPKDPLLGNNFDMLGGFDALKSRRLNQAKENILRHQEAVKKRKRYLEEQKRYNDRRPTITVKCGRCGREVLAPSLNKHMKSLRCQAHVPVVQRQLSTQKR